MTESLRDIDLQSQYFGYDDRLNGFYIPALSHANRYDRVAGYWRASSLSAAATGLVEFIRRGGTMRIIAGAELSEADVAVLDQGRPLEDVVTEVLLQGDLSDATDLVAAEYLDVLAWMLREDRLEIRIGVPLGPDGERLKRHEANAIFHTKYGLLYEIDHPGSDVVAFVGSDNESATGWKDNHETFSVYRSWKPEIWAEYGAPLEADFATHWETGYVPGWQVIDLPQAVAEDLIKRVSDDYEPPAAEPGHEVFPLSPDIGGARIELEELMAKPKEAGGTGVGFETAAITPWPHQTAIAAQAVADYPDRSYLLADEVGLGKTIEAGLILRELLLSGKASTALLLVPASVMKQWQEELWEKFALMVPRYTGKTFEDVYGNELKTDATNPWNGFDLVLASSHLARRRARQREILAAEPWDVVLIDEAHHAGRKGSKPEDTPNRLLELLLEMRDAQKWQVLYLATATPMQMHAHEAWDLLELTNLDGQWAKSAAAFESYYQQLAQPPMGRDWPFLKRMDSDFFITGRENRKIKDKLGTLTMVGRSRIEQFPKNGVQKKTLEDMGSDGLDLLDKWLAVHTPMQDRVFRTTRDTLRAYRKLGVLPADAVIPTRVIDDAPIVFRPDDEQPLYDRIEEYISKYYDRYTADDKTKPLGFIMTIYRRRLTSSFAAIEKSLERRLAVLEGDALAEELLSVDDLAALETTMLFDPEDLDQSGQDMAEEIGELQSFLKKVKNRPPDESKMKRLHHDLAEGFSSGGQKTAVIFTQYTDTMDYIRDQLKNTYGSQVACYSGRGGERWDPATSKWEPVEKAVVKELFRKGKDVKILIGTDAMSEGLNLQTCGKLINYDLPWNFMRVEQRIGRVDRIGGQKTIHISNYLYEGTVERQVYDGIARDFNWFEHVVGPAQPVLGSIEGRIEELAMRKGDKLREKRVAEIVEDMRLEMSRAEKEVVQLDDVEGPDVESSGYAAAPAITMRQFADTLLTNELTKDKFSPHPDITGVFLLDLGEDTQAEVTFDRNVYDRHTDVQFLTYGHALLDRFVDSVGS
ncbi:MAG: SNF2-related protein [Acidimicrobiia bacterium]|nr:SNF2-related protein [Acidimicrobiia bacterium]